MRSTAGSESIYQLFKQSVKTYPDAIAVSYLDQRISYKALDLIVDLAASKIESSANPFVAVSATRNLEMIVGLLAIFKAGKAYLPLDISYPKERLALMVKDSNVNFCFCNKEENSFFSNLIKENVSTTNVTTENSENKIGYILYTSGSTGKPKGVCLGAEALLNLLDWQLKSSISKVKSKTLQYSPLTFDPSFLEIFATFSIGGELVLIDDELRLDPFRLLHFLESEKIERLFLPFVALQMIAETAVELRIFPSSLKEVMTAGEQLKVTPQLASFFENLPDSRLFNQYGPTECHVVTQLKLEGNPAAWPPLPSIGIPIQKTDIYILDENGKLLPDGAIGELCIAGISLAEGYLNRPELTNEKFIFWNHPYKGEIRIYKSGDLSKYLPDGNIEFLGRKDNQVKVRGYRIELGEIEVKLSEIENIKDAVVVAHENKLFAYLVAKNQSIHQSELRLKLQKTLPDYMIPSQFIWMDEFPKTSSGKVDRNALNIPKSTRSNHIPYQKPVSSLEKIMVKVWEELLKIEEIGVNDNFFELGGNSLLAQKVIIKFYQQNIKLPITKLYQLPTIALIGRFLEGEKPTFKKVALIRDSNKNRDVAIIGMNGRFPGAENVAQLWEMLKAGKEGITFFEDQELDEFIPDKIKDDPQYVKARGILKQTEYFDAEFWNINPKLASLMNPQQRIFLEICRDLLESKGYLPAVYDGVIGIFAGAGSNSYFHNHVLSHPELIDQAGKTQVDTLNDKDYIASRTAFHLNLKGPAVSVYAACSTSLLAVAQAVESIRNGQNQIALAGGISITTPMNSGHIYEDGAMFSKDGHTRTFDAEANGTVFSDGAGVVLLKSLEDAIADGDFIYSVIKGVGVNNDGSEKSSFTAPNPAGQASAINMAMDDAEVKPEDISYIEAHGTATPVGDPLEIEGLQLVFSEATEKQFCAIGSLKSNIGHLTHAAGVAGLIKTSLSLHHQIIPPTINFNQENPLINFNESAFYVSRELKNWENNTSRLAGVSSFGVGGTNVHVIVSEYENKPISKSSPTDVALITYSAKSAESVSLYEDKLLDFIQQHPEKDIGDIAYTLQSTRENFSFRKSIAVKNLEDFKGELQKKTSAQELKEAVNEVVFLFPGQGAQYLQMGKELYESESVYKTAIDECAEILKSCWDEDIKSILFGDEEKKLNNTYYTQPAIFITSYALAKLWMHWGVNPQILIGHSIGEFVAAHFAGVFSLADALKLIVHRGKLVSTVSKGSMLAVKSSVETLNLPADLSIATINTPKQCVVSGTDEAISAFSKELDKNGIANKVLKTSHAFHSYMMDEIVVPFQKMVSQIKLHIPQKPIISTVTAQFLTDQEATDPAYWANHMRATVNFAGAIQFLAINSSMVLLEVGPGKSLSTAAIQTATVKCKSIAGIESNENLDSEKIALFNALGKLWTYGFQPDWKIINGEKHFNKIELPTYAYNRKKYWLNPVKSNITASTFIETLAEEIVTEKLSKNDLLRKNISFILENASGISVGPAAQELSLIELGFDSLLLTQVALTLRKEFGLPISFKQLSDELMSVELLANYLEHHLPETYFEKNSNGQRVSNESFIDESTSSGLTEIKANPFGAIAKIEKSRIAINEKQEEFIADFNKRFNQKTKSSKEYTQKNRSHMADPRVVTGFKPLTKEMVYPIVVNKSKGSRLWDLDGNEYVDALNGFGSSLFGYQPDFIKKAVLEQVEKGYEVGPQHELAGEVCKLICEFTNFDRSALCNTGSEAVLGALRIARTVTGKSLIVVFTGSYHGINDEVIVRGSQQLRSFAAAPGIMNEAVMNTLVLEYGTEESLKVIRERANEFAAVLVEPVQSRKPEFQPIEFLKEVRKITEEHHVALIFDEVITGFRSHPNGTQGLFAIKADIGTYGKVIGGGMPIGAIAGKREWMDTLDGGFWQFGDDSFPEVGVTYFAGTFVRHPLALAAGLASLKHMKSSGPALQEEISKMTLYLADELNAICKKLSLPIHIVHFSSLWKIKFKIDYPYYELLFKLMCEKGIHIWDGFPCFLTEAHSKEDVDLIIEAFDHSVRDLRIVNLIPTPTKMEVETHLSFNKVPLPHAKLGKDKSGNPGWFLEDDKNSGEYLQVLTQN
ncbi:MAG: amino acid adenylation domain-containing protein [Pelobium sp.]